MGKYLSSLATEKTKQENMSAKEKSNSGGWENSDDKVGQRGSHVLCIICLLDCLVDLILFNHDAPVFFEGKPTPPPHTHTLSYTDHTTKSTLM